MTSPQSPGGSGDVEFARFSDRCTERTHQQLADRESKEIMNREHPGDGGRSPGEQFWEAHYRKHDRLWSGRANAMLVEVAEPLPPGTALDIGCGEGGEAIWLAQFGWRVTAIDVSATALQRAANNASAAEVAAMIDFQQHDLPPTFPGGTFDLVSAHYLQSPVEFPRVRVLQTAAQAVAPGGRLLIVDHASVSPWSWADPETRFPAPEEALAALDLDTGEWTTERLEAPSRQATGPNGASATVIDDVVEIRRRRM